MARIKYVPNRVIDHNGISDGANVFVYQSGTTTPVQLYLDEALTEPVSNPYPVPTGAPVPVLYHDFAGNVRMRVVAADGSVPLDEDPYDTSVLATDLASPNGATLVGLPQGGKVSDAVKWVTPEMFGAIGDDEADDTAAILAFFAAAAEVGVGIMGVGRTYKVTSPIPITLVQGLDIRCQGSTLKFDITLAADERLSLVYINSPTYLEGASVRVSDLHIDCSLIPYFETISNTDRRGLFALRVRNVENIEISNYKASNVFYGAGLYLRGYKNARVTNLILEDVGSKFHPTQDDTSAWDAAGDAIYLGDIVGEGSTTLENIYASSYSSKYGRIGVVMEDLSAVTTRHLVSIKNAVFKNYQRVLHQEDGGKSVCTWDGGFASGFSNLLFNLGGRKGITHFKLNAVEAEVTPPFSYGGTSGVQNFQGDGQSIFSGCTFTYGANVQDRGAYSVWDSTINLGTYRVTHAVSNGYGISYDNCQINSTGSGGEIYSTTNPRITLNNCRLTTAGAEAQRMLYVGAAASIVSIDNCRFTNAYPTFVNISSSLNPVRVTGTTFNFQSITSGFVFGAASASSRILYDNCKFYASGLSGTFYGDAGVDNSFRGCEVNNIRLQYINGDGEADGRDFSQVAASKFVYTDGYDYTTPLMSSSGAVLISGTLFLDKTTAQNITAPPNSAKVITAGTGNVLRNNTATTLL